MSVYSVGYCVQMIREAIDFAEQEGDFTKARIWVNNLVASLKEDELDQLEKEVRATHESARDFYPF